MVEDGLPPELILTPEERRAGWVAELKEQRAKAQIKETDEMKTNTQPSKADQVKGLRERRSEAKGSNPDSPFHRLMPKAAKMPKKADRAGTGAKAAKAKARAPVSGKPASGPDKAVRPGSKLEIVVGLLTRKGGCTSADILEATEWPAVSVPQQARAAGLTLRQEKDGKVTRYWAS